jgi:phospholipid/cholesterol/gamma-HCH transport system substrate-binding protein
MAEDTEALKHNFFFKGFFKHRGYYNLSSLSPEDGAHGSEALSEDGRKAIDAAIASFGDAVFQQPIVIEGTRMQLIQTIS